MFAHDAETGQIGTGVVIVSVSAKRRECRSCADVVCVAVSTENVVGELHSLTRDFYLLRNRLQSSCVAWCRDHERCGEWPNLER